MSSITLKPKWWQVYVMLPVLVSLFLFEMSLPLTSTENIIAQLGILFLIYGFIHVWMRANRRALMGLDEQQGEWRMRVYEIPPTQLTGTSHDGNRSRQRPLFHLPEAGLKGLLDDTFEMEVRPEEPGSVFSNESSVSRKV